MSKTFLITVEFQGIRAGVLGKKGLEAYYVERDGEKGIFGNIYKGKVESVVPGIQAAFVNLGLDINGFLYISEITHWVREFEDILEGRKVISDKGLDRKENVSITQLLKPGQEILVQVIREPINSKGPRLTTHVSLPGRYLVLMPFDKHIGISRRIKDTNQRKYLKSIIDSLSLPKNMGLIVRTSAKMAKKKDIFIEYKYLLKQWKKLEKKARVSKSPSLIFEERDLVLRVMRDMLTEEVDKVFIDSKIEYKRAQHFLKKFGRNMRKKVNYYRKTTPLFKDFGVQKEIERIYERKVDLECGGHILIESTESLVAVDVNSGGYVGKKDLENTAFLVNMQAAEEIMKQIKLRDLGGIIIIDFIDMKKSDHIKQLLQRIKSLLKSDKAETDFWYSPRVGLVEMTRQRGRRSIKSISYQECPYCQGKGMIKSPVTVAIQAVREIEKIINQKSPFELTVKLHPEVVKFLLTKNILEELKYSSKVNINLKKEPNFHLEQIEIEN